MALREKRSVSLPPDLAKEIDQAAEAAGSSFSAWIAETASHRLRLEAGRRGVAEWELEHGALTEQELAEGLHRARELLGRTSSSAPASKKRSA
jgi:predicted transcriptional regulator